MELTDEGPVFCAQPVLSAQLTNELPDRWADLELEAEDEAVAKRDIRRADSPPASEAGRSSAVSRHTEANRHAFKVEVHDSSFGDGLGASPCP